VADLHAQFADLGAYQANMLDVSGLDRETTQERVEQALAGGQVRIDQ